jgi:hypothetical protein
MGSKRFDIFFERHFGIGLRWDSFEYPIHISLALPFITITVGIGRPNTNMRLEERSAAE